MSTTNATARPSDDLFLGMSHGTLECRDIPQSRAFHGEFLGLQTLRHSEPSYITWLDERKFFIACVGTGDQTGVQGVENRWELSVGSDEEVLAARQAAEQQQERWGIRTITPLSEQDGYKWFALQDVNGNWWGISSRGADWFDKAFANAEVSA